jgi:predicted ribosome quality control (RQC) complex YloA/Tae2 family protein
MTHAQLHAIARYLGRHRHIKKARRVEKNTLELNLGGDESLFFEMTRGAPTVRLGPSRRPGQDFNAPFDTLLHQLLSQSRLLEAEVPEGERILRLTVQPRSHYKDRRVTLQLEFTGRHANAILLDEQGCVIEALRHIDADRSFRVVRPGVELLPLPPRPQNREEKPFDGEIESWLRENHRRILRERLESLRQQKRGQILKKRRAILESLERLPDEAELEAEAELHQKRANLILAHLHEIRPYDRELTVRDFDGTPVTIPLPEGVARNRLGEHYFHKARRARTKAKNVHIERENLEAKLRFYDNILQAIEEAKEPHDLELLVPRQGRARRRKEKLRDGELYWIEGYKVYVGRNARENQKLLEAARSNDLWMHTREIPGSHVLVRTDKQNLPESVLRSAAKLCVDFSTDRPGNYAVDYTRRKFVKIQEGSRVEYDKYKTIQVLKEGVEIRE